MIKTLVHMERMKLIARDFCRLRRSENGLASFSPKQRQRLSRGIYQPRKQNITQLYHKTQQTFSLSPVLHMFMNKKEDGRRQSMPMLALFTRKKARDLLTRTNLRP